MAYDFMGLVNDVNGRLNEVPLTSSTFANATGFYAQAKESVNSSLRDINQTAFEWPFNHVTQEDTLTENQVRYGNPSDAKSINFDSFRIKGDSDTITTHLRQMDYEEYLMKYSDADYNPSNYAGVPRQVFRCPSLEFGIYPPPDEAYTLVYEYYRVPVDLINATDVPYVPEQFRHIIVDGAMAHAYMFRGDPESSMAMFEKWREGVKNMRGIYQNRYEYVRSGYLPHTRIVGVRVG